MPLGSLVEAREFKPMFEALDEEARRAEHDKERYKAMADEFTSAKEKSEARPGDERLAASKEAAKSMVAKIAAESKTSQDKLNDSLRSASKKSGLEPSKLIAGLAVFHRHAETAAVLEMLKCAQTVDICLCMMPLGP